MAESLPKRKSCRMAGYDYAQAGAYFITICTHNKEMLLGDAGAHMGEQSAAAKMIDDCFTAVLTSFPSVSCPNCVIMPNHFHAILMLAPNAVQTSVCEFIQSFKRVTTIGYIKMVKAGKLPPFHQRLWQRSFHDHVIRNENEFDMIWRYIDNNPLIWENDCFYRPTDRS